MSFVPAPRHSKILSPFTGKVFISTPEDTVHTSPTEFPRPSGLLMPLPLLTTLVLSHGRALHGRADGGHFVRPDRSADVVSRNVDYVVGNTTYEGFWSVPKGVAPKAGLLIAHQYMGLIDYEKSRAEEFAASGYGVFALDVYGKGVRCNTTDCAKATMNKALSDLPKLRSLINAGANQLLHEWGTGADPTKLVAMGCTTATLERDSFIIHFL